MKRKTPTKPAKKKNGKPGRPTKKEVRYRNVGRPTRMDKATLHKLEEAFSWGCSDREACLWAGIAPATLYKYQEKNPEFVERKETLKDTPIIKARRNVHNSIESGSVATAEWLLERKRKDEYSPRQELTDKDGAPLLSSYEQRMRTLRDMKDGSKKSKKS